MSIELEGSEDSGLEEQVRWLWSAYAWLRDTDLRSESGTSRLLHDGDLGYLRSRLEAELKELAGVLSGEHRHSTPSQDVVLEGSQICYWVYLIALCSGTTYDDLQPHELLALAVGQTEASKDALPGETGTPAARTKPQPIERQGPGWRPQGHPANSRLQEPTVRHGARISAHEGQNLLSLLVGALQAVGAACRALGVDARAVVQYDIAQMVAQPYMERALTAKQPRKASD